MLLKAMKSEIGWSLLIRFFFFSNSWQRLGEGLAQTEEDIREDFPLQLKVINPASQSERQPVTI